MLSYKLAVITCLDIANPINGRIDFYPDTLANFDFLTTATYVCDFGYGIRGVTAVQTCVAESYGIYGVWNGTVPSCEGVYILKYVLCINYVNFVL